MNINIIDSKINTALNIDLLISDIHFNGCSITDIVLFDIETTGLNAFSSYVYLIGVIWHDGSSFMLKQFFMDDFSYEKELITAFLDFIRPFKLIVNYNGTGFDIPYITTKTKLHCLNTYYMNDTAGFFGATTRNLDLYKLIRPLKNVLKTHGLKQKNVESFFGVNRTDLLSGNELIDIYARYTGLKRYEKLAGADASPDNPLIKEAGMCEDLLLLHNADDLKGLLELLVIPSIISFFRGNFKISGCCISDIPGAGQPEDTCLSSKAAAFYKKLCDNIGIRYSGLKIIRTVLSLKAASLLPCDFTACFELPMPDCGISLSSFMERYDDSIILYIPALFCKLNYYFPDYKDYFYLPYEDSIVHKSVAAYVDKSHKTKAKKEQCKKEASGFFTPVTIPTCTPSFKLSYNDKVSFFNACDILNTSSGSGCSTSMFSSLSELYSFIHDYILYTVFGSGIKKLL